MRELVYEFRYGVFGVGYDVEKVYREGGRLVLYGENISSHPWKEREYSEQFVREITEKELEEAIKREKQIIEEKRKKLEEEEKERKKWFEWVKKLKEAGLPVNSRGEVVDDWDNPLFPLPKNLLGTSPEKVQEWINKQFEQYEPFDFFD